MLEEHTKRKQLGLPISKPLRYMKHRLGGYDEIKVIDFEIEKTYPSGWHTLCITLETGEKVKIHSAYFAEMQKASFIKDIKEQELKTERMIK